MRRLRIARHERPAVERKRTIESRERSKNERLTRARRCCALVRGERGAKLGDVLREDACVCKGSLKSSRGVLFDGRLKRSAADVDAVVRSASTGAHATALPGLAPVRASMLLATKGKPAAMAWALRCQRGAD